MKKIIFCLTALIFVGCGGGSNSSESSAEPCIQPGNHKCNGNMLLVCNGQKEWQDKQLCSSGQTCNPTTGTCDGGSSNGGNGGNNNGGSNGSNNGNNNGGNGGNNNGGNEDDACSNVGSYLCNGKIVLICGEDAKWQKYKQCSDNQTCNATKGTCDNNGNGGGDNGGGNSGGTGDYECYEIYDCQNKCGSDSDCKEDCFYNGTSTAQSEASTMYTCWDSYCSNTDDDISSCIDNNCYDKTIDCGLYTDTNCPAIYNCISECSDQDCANSCYSNGSSAGRNRYDNLIGCYRENGCFDVETDDEWKNCIYDYCDDEIYDCGFRD